MNDAGHSPTEQLTEADCAKASLQSFNQYSSTAEARRIAVSELVQLPLSVRGKFSADSEIVFSVQALDALKKGNLKISLINQQNNLEIKGLRAFFGNVEGNIVAGFGFDHATIVFGNRCQGAFEARLWRDSTLLVGDDTTSNGTKIVCDKSAVSIGKDCMFSSDILVQAADQHGLVDIDSGRIVNDLKRSTVIGDHVWVGRRAIITPDVCIGRGAVVGTGAIVTSAVPDSSVVVGVPARVIRLRTTWCRSPSKLDQFSETIIREAKSNS